ncbi:MAG: hypothetical protein ACR2PS_07170 [Pseudomonadales bacterium]
MKGENPFPGLRPFGVEESHLFFGRERPTDELLRKLRTNRFIAVVGTSGSGKSSLVRAGMLPDLHGGMMTSAGSSWRVAVCRPGNAPVRALAEVLSLPEVFGSTGEDAAMQTAITETVLRRGAKGLVDATLQARMAPHENLLVVVDQFEELFRFKSSRSNVNAADEAAAFVKLLLEACKQESTPIYVVLTMRSEFLGDCTQFRDLPEAINEGQYLIPRMTRDQRKEAITGPVAVSGARMAPRLMQRLLNDVGDNPDQLPILQHAMMRTWDNWAQQQQPDEPIDISHYEAIGTMTEALSQHADEAFNELPDDKHRQLAKKIFKRLTEKGMDNRELRFPTEVGELCRITEAREQEVIAVIEAFRQEGRWFLMPPPEVALNAKSLIDISHESLIRIWRRLRRWVNEEAESVRIYKRLAETSALYKKEEAGLWRNPDLQIALQWHKRNRPTETWAQRYQGGFTDAMAFLNESKTAARRRRNLILAPIVLIPALLVGMGIRSFTLELRAEKQAKLEAEAQLDESVFELNQIEAKEDKEQQIQKKLIRTAKKMAKLEKQGKDDQALKEKLLETVDKLAVLEGQNKTNQATKVEVPAANLAALESKPIAETQKTVKNVAADMAAIRSEQDFVTCTEVARLEPRGISKEFAPGRVYVFARVYAPKEESLTLKWYDGDGKELWERQLKVHKNLATGFRTYAWKTLSKAGPYEVVLFDSDQVELGRRQFTVSEA